MNRGLTFLFAVAGGVAVGNLYWAQPLLEFIGRDLDASPSTAGWLVTATQIGYACGVVLIVPLGDVVDRHRLIPLMMTLAAFALAACAAAPSIGVLLVAIAAVGITTVSGQILVPLAGDLADDTQRGRVVGTVASGILTGILVSRTLSGLIAGWLGWRAIFAVAAVLAVGFATVLFRAIPTLPPKNHLPYPALLRSVAAVVARERTVRWTLVLGAIGFAVLAMFWTSLTFLLSVSPTARSRLNTVFVAGNFIGGAAGSALAAVLWNVDGWVAVTTAGALLSVVALGVWAVGSRRGALVTGVGVHSNS